MYLGREMRHAGWGNNWTVRLFRRNRRFIERRVHEGLEPVRDVGRLAEPMEHTPYRDLAHHWRKLTLYAAWGAEDLAETAAVRGSATCCCGRRSPSSGPTCCNAGSWKAGAAPCCRGSPPLASSSNTHDSGNSSPA